ncbi:MAG: zinc ribbon domain-containing protein, partial [Colwellia sp.]|nr:zinc ribbon domain-containing protein [Colwellia sp.]
MPVYEYECLDCKKVSSLLQKVGTKEEDTICPECGSKKVNKILSSFCCAKTESGAFAPSFSSGSGG